MAGLSGVHRFAFNDDLQPAVTATGAGLAFAGLLFGQGIKVSGNR
jgi:hypothetical protein